MLGGRYIRLGKLQSGLGGAVRFVWRLNGNAVGSSNRILLDGTTSSQQLHVHNASSLFPFPSLRPNRR